MNIIFKRVIEIDNRAKELYCEAAREKERLQQSTLTEIKGMESDIKLMADEKIERLISQSRKDLENKINDINNNLKEKLSAMEEKYIRNADMWEQKIFLNVIGE